MVKKLVISYSTSDRGIAENLREKLMGTKYDVWTADGGLLESVQWTQTILDVIDERDGLVLLWSEQASQSEFVREEIRVARVFLKPIFPVFAHPDEEVPALPEEIGPLQVIKKDDFNSVVAELVKRLSDPNRNNIEYPTIDVKGYIPKRPTPYFVGRNKELKELFVDSYGFQGKTKKGNPIAISGLAGIGKTQLALEFAYRFNLFFPDGVYWVDMPSGIVQEFEKIGKDLGVEKLLEERPLDYANRVKHKLSQLNRGLVIFDNVDDINEFQKWYPQGNKTCSVIFTTRKSPRGFAVRVMNLIDLDADAAYELVLSRRPIIDDEKQKQALKEICQIMGNHPLALELCASYLQDEFVNPEGFLEELKRENPLDFISSRPEFSSLLLAGEANLLQVLSKNYESLDPSVVDPYFLLMSCFAPYGINTELIMNAYGDRESGTNALRTLANHSLIYRESNDRTSLHPLVAQYGKSLEMTKDEDYNKKFVEVIADFLHKNKDDLSGEKVRLELSHISKAREVSKELGYWELCSQLYEYSADIVKGVDTQIAMLKGAYEIITDNLPGKNRQLPDLRVRLGKARRKKGQAKDALTEFENAETLYAVFANVNPVEKAILQYEIGSAFLAMGEYKECGKRLKRALNIALKEAFLDETSQEVTRINQALARRDLFLGNYNEAEKKFKEILDHRERYYNNRPEEVNLDVSSSYADMGRLMLQRSNYDEAGDYVEKALKIIYDHQKQNDPAYGELLLLKGQIYNQSGNYKLAEDLLDQCLLSLEKTYGEKHPSYARALISLGDVRRTRGKFAEAQQDIDQAIEIFEARYGKVHPLIADALEVRGKIFNHLHKFDEEAQVWKRVIAIQESVYSGDHPALAKTYFNFANLFLHRGQFAKAIEQLDISIKITVASLGKTHSEYFGRLVRLAVCHYRQQNFPKSQQILNQAKKLVDSVFGTSLHPYIARMHQLQSGIYRHSAKFKEALKSIDKAIEIKEEIYDRDHPSVAESLEKKVKILHHLGVTTGAMTLIQRSLEIREKRYGKDHHEYSHSIHDLGSYYLRQGQYGEAIKQFEEAIRIVENTYDKKHPEYSERRFNLANAYYEKGDYDAALGIFIGEERTLEETISIKNHPLKARWLFGMGELYRRKGSFKLALDFVEDAIDMLKALHGGVHPAVAEAKECQGQIYHHLGMFEEEESIWRDVIDLKFYPTNHPAIANTHYNYSNLLLRRSEFNEAIVHLNEAIRITEESLGEEHSHYFRYLIRLARCYYELQNYSDAQEKLNEAKDLLMTIFGEDAHPYIARMHQLQSEIYRRLGKFKKALESIDLAIVMKEGIYDDKHPSVAESLEVKVKIYHHTGEHSEAKKLIDRALMIRKNHYGENHHEYSRSVHDLGSYFLNQGQYDEAIERFEEAIRIVRSALGENHPEYMERTLHLANAHYEKGAYDKSLSIVAGLGKRIEKIVTVKNHYLKATWQYRMAHLYRRKGIFTEAMDYVNKAIEMRDALYGKVHPLFAEVLVCKAKIFGHLGQFDDEEMIWQEILEVQKKVYTENHPAVANTYYDYGNFYLNKGEFAKAAELLETSIKITGDSLGTNHSHYFGSLVRWARCFYEQQIYTRAQEILREAEDLRQGVFDDSPHPYIARLYQLQSEIDQQLGDFENALRNIDATIEMKVGIYNENHPSVAEALEIKVDLLLAQFQTKDAKLLLDRVEQIRRDSYGVEHLAYANYQMRLADYHSKLNDFDEAQDVLSQSLNVCLEKFSDEHPEIIKRRVRLAYLARIKGEVPVAEKQILEASKALGERMELEGSLVVSSVLKESSNVHRKKSEYNEAWSEIEKAFNIEHRILGGRSPGVTELLINKAKLKVVSGELDKAEEFIQKALDNTEAGERVYKSLRAEALEQYGLLESSRKEFSKAIETINGAIKLRKEVSGVESVELAKLYIEKARVLRQFEDYNEAITLLDKAQNINNPRFDENHVYFARILLENGWTLYEKNNSFAARGKLEEALEIYSSQPEQDLRERANTSEVLGLVYLDLDLAKGQEKASKYIKEALTIKEKIFSQGHPEIAQTLDYMSQLNAGRSTNGKVAST